MRHEAAWTWRRPESPPRMRRALGPGPKRAGLVRPGAEPSTAARAGTVQSDDGQAKAKDG